MRNANIIFLTGITGTVGSWLAREALHNGSAVKALVRSKTKQAATKRVEDVLKIVGIDETANGVEVLCGDITQEGLGLDREIDKLRECSLIVHCGACTEFGDDKKELNYITNVEGTRNVLEMAEKLSLPIVYISTAYIAGKREGVVREDELDVGQSFNNAYEQSKCQGELMVRQWSDRTSLPTIILRPSIVVGDSRQGRAVRFNTVYDLMRVFEILTPHLKKEEIRIIANPMATKNFIPADYFAKVAWQLIGRRVSGTYHITHPDPITMDDLQGIFTHMFGIRGIKLIDSDTFHSKSPTSAERLCQNASSVYLPYMSAEPCFDRSNTEKVLANIDIDVPSLNLDLFQQLLDYARSVDWGRKRGGKFSQTSNIPSGISRYFSEFLKEKMHRELMPDLRNLTACFNIVLQGGSKAHWTISVAKGILRDVSQNGAEAQCSFLVDVPTFCGIAAGRISPQQAFFKRRIEIEGDIEIGLKVATVLAAFFRKYPYEVKLG